MIINRSKLGLIIGQVTKREYAQISDLLATSLIEAKPKHQELFQYLFENKNVKQPITRESINKIIFSKKLTDAQVRLYMSELYKMVSQALVMIQSKNDWEYQNRVLIDRFKNNENQKLYDSQFAIGKRKLEGYPYRNHKYFQLKYELAFREYNQISSTKRTQDLNLQELLDDVDHIFISQKLRQACFAISHQSVYGQEYNYGLLDAILLHIEQNDLLNIPAISLYYSGYKMLSQPKEAKFFNDFRNKIDTFKQLFPHEELQSIYIFAINQCIRLLNRGHLEYGHTTLDLYQESLDNKYLYIDGHISRFTYRNMAAIAVKIGEYDRAETFTIDNRSALKKEERESAFHFNQALISYHRKDFDTALTSLQVVDFKDHLFNLAAKVIQMKVYYESDDYDLLESHLDAMQMYLLRKKVIGYHKTNYRNIIKMTRKLLKTNKRDKSAVMAIVSDIESIEVLTEKKWLINQLT